MTRDEGIEYLKTVPEKEPVFVLRAQDAFAPSTIQVWATLCSSERNEATRAKGDRAAGLVKKMQKWQEKHARKIPD